MLVQREIVRLEEIAATGDVYATMSAYAQQQGGGNYNGGGPGNSGEAPGTGGGTSMNSPSGSGGGVLGETNTATGNLLTSVPLLNFPVRGQLSVGLTLYHNSMVTTGSTVNYTLEPIGKKWKHNYDMRVIPTGNNATVIMQDGLEAPYLDDGTANNTQKFKRPEGFFYALTKDTTNSTWTLQHRSGAKWLFNSDGYLVTIKDQQGVEVTVVRDSANGHRVTQVYGMDNTAHRRTLQFTYRTNGSLEKVEVTEGTKTKTFWFTQAADGTLTNIINQSSAYRIFGYNSDFNLSQETNWAGTKTVWTYCASPHQNRLATAADPDQSYVITYTYTNITPTSPHTTGNGQTITNGMKVSITNALGNETQHIYENGKLREIVDPLGYKVVRVYDSSADKNVTKVWSQNSTSGWVSTDFENYNAMGQPGLIKRDGAETELTYNAAWQVAQKKIKEAAGQYLETAYEYDSSFRLWKIKDDSGAVVQTRTYNSYGDVTGIYDGLNRATTLEYDSKGYGDVVGVTTSGSNATESVYTTFSREFGLPKTVTTEGELKATYEYNVWGQPIEITDAAGEVTTIERDGDGNVLSIIDPEMNATAFTYRPDNLLESVSADGFEETYAYDLAQRRTSVTNGRGVTRTYEYNARGDLIKMTMPQVGNHPSTSNYDYVEEWSYAPSGAVLAFSASDLTGNDLKVQRSIAYLYNNRGQNTKIDYTGMTDTTFEYDLVGRRTKMIDASGTTQWFYNSDGELFKMTSPQGEVQYVYSDAGELTTLKNIQTGGSSLDTVYAYTASTGRLASITSPWNEVTSFAYDGQGRLSQKTLPNGLREEISYDSSDRLDTLHIRNVSTNAILRSESYAYDSRGNVTLHNLGGVQTTYGYDPLGQLTSESRAGYSATYTYDGNGNRLTKTLNGVTETYSYDQGDKLLDIKIGTATQRSFVYDEQGRTKEDSRLVNGAWQTRVYSYDQESRITSVNLPNTTADPSYTYNGLDTRVGMSVSGNSTSWKRAGAYVTEPVLSGAGVDYVPGVSSRAGGVSTFTHAGMKNTTAQSVSASLSAIKQFDAFGNVTSSTGTWQTPFDYAGNFGYQNGADGTGLMLLGHRYYDPTIGRFLTRDPVKDGRNWYGYGGGQNSPIAFADPDGRLPILLIAVVAVLIISTVPAVAPGPEDIGTPSSEFQGQATQESAGIVGKLFPQLAVAALAIACAAGAPPPWDSGSSGDWPNPTPRKLKKRTIMREWSEKNGRDWPVGQDGKPFDADHDIPLSLGGDDSIDNITPRPRDEHIDRHRKSGHYKMWGSWGKRKK